MKKTLEERINGVKERINGIEKTIKFLESVDKESHHNAIKALVNAIKFEESWIRRFERSLERENEN